MLGCSQGEGTLFTGKYCKVSRVLGCSQGEGTLFTVRIAGYLVCWAVVRMREPCSL